MFIKINNKRINVNNIKYYDVSVDYHKKYISYTIIIHYHFGRIKIKTGDINLIRKLDNLLKTEEL